jgi:Na+/proline symporter
VTALDYWIVALYLVGTLAFGAWHARRASSSTEQFFAAGRSLPWWLAGTSIVATTFAADTPLAVAGLVATEGVWGNWFWWADVLPAATAALLVAELWRRSGVLTDNEIVELRYGGRPAAGLRLFRALYFGVLRNALVIGWVNLAMLKVLELGLDLEPGSGVLVLAGLFLITVLYTLLSGLLGVVLTDLVQFGMALGGSLLLAVLAVQASGGLGALPGELARVLGETRAEQTLALVPEQREAFWAFVIYVAIKSWASGNTEGNGYMAQRLLATRDERHARLAALWFAVAHFALRPWPWILVGIAALLSYPALEDPESGYVLVLLDQLPQGLRGLMIATLFAAFMSTVDTQLNWGASYLTHDVFHRFLRPDASERTLVAVARASVVLLAALGALATLAMPSISGAWKFLASLLAGTGLVLLLRWLWWRINAWSEIVVMASSLLGTNVLLLATDIAFPFSLALVVAFSVPAALLATLLTAPEAPETLAAFYRLVRPRGAWGPVARACGEQPRALGVRPWADVLLMTAGVYGVMLGTGALLLGSPLAGVLGLLAGIAALALAVSGASAPRSPAAPPRT